jgi:hypothetical protein
MRYKSSALRCAFAMLACVPVLAMGASTNPDGQDKASINVKATPSVGFSPARIVATAEIKGGRNDAEDLYCASIEWVWGDDTKSESREDCEPYEAGRSEIKRRYTLDHVYQTAGNYRLEFYLKRNNKRILGGRTTITIRPGARDIGY